MTLGLEQADAIRRGRQKCVALPTPAPFRWNMDSCFAYCLMGCISFEYVHIHVYTHNTCTHVYIHAHTMHAHTCTNICSIHVYTYIHMRAKAEPLPCSLEQRYKAPSMGATWLGHSFRPWSSYLEIALGSEGPAADSAAEGLLPSVGALMDLQGTG